MKPICDRILILAVALTLVGCSGKMKTRPSEAQNSLGNGTSAAMAGGTSMTSIPTMNYDIVITAPDANYLWFSINTITPASQFNFVCGYPDNQAAFLIIQLAPGQVGFGYPIQAGSDRCSFLAAQRDGQNPYDQIAFSVSGTPTLQLNFEINTITPASQFTATCTDPNDQASIQFSQVPQVNGTVGVGFPLESGSNNCIVSVPSTPADPWLSIAAEAQQTSYQIGEHLNSVLGYASNLDDWQNRATMIRSAIMKGAQLDPLPEKTPLNPIRNELKIHDTYSVENVAFEASPGFFVTGNLFIPRGKTGPFPAIIVSHGHFGNWGGYARTLAENQILVTRLAEMGAVVFTYDMVGWGDSQQLDHPDSYGHFGFGDQDHFNDGTSNNLLQLQLWDSIRALDFVESLQDDNNQPLVDMTKVGVTGASGGATQSLNLAAVDPRISAASLVVMITAGFTGNDYCEDGMPIHAVPPYRDTNNTEIAATLAPKPVLIMSDGNDWTANFNRDEYSYMKQIWRFFDTNPLLMSYENRALNFHFPNEGHDYKDTKRARTYEFFSVAFGLTQLPNIGDPNDPNNNVEGVFLEDPNSLKVFSDQNPRPLLPMRHLLKQ